MLARVKKAVKWAIQPRGALAALRTREFRADLAHHTRRWDDEWLSYMVTEKAYAYVYFINRRAIDRAECDKHAPQLPGLSCEEFYEFNPLDYNAFAVWGEGKWVPGATIVELGCGPGMLGKAIAPFCKQYIGIDYSKLALHIARLTSPDNCRYLHLSQIRELRALRSSCDLCVGRYFFIHQNWKNATWVLALYRHLLRPGGRVSADFFAKSNEETDGNATWLVHTPEEPLVEGHPSCLFEYSDDHIHRLAKECGFAVDRIDYRPKYQRRFAILVKE
jgi:SAM-dependent methyltransferase